MWVIACSEVSGFEDLEINEGIRYLEGQVPVNQKHVIIEMKRYHVNLLFVIRINLSFKS